ncbi:ProQ/FINO family protein, partial [Herbiconiux daphne]
TYRTYIPILEERFPIAFNRDNPLPLEVGVFEKLIALPDLGMCDDELDCVLQCWTARREYCRSAVLIGWRHDLIGQRVERIGGEDLLTYQNRYSRFIRRGMLQ